MLVSGKNPEKNTYTVTYRIEGGEPTRGMLHSDSLRTTERIWFDSESHRLNVAIEHTDEVFFSRDFEVVTAQYQPTDLELQPFNCRPENADHTLIDSL